MTSWNAKQTEVSALTFNTFFSEQCECRCSCDNLHVNRSTQKENKFPKTKTQVICLSMFWWPHASFYFVMPSFPRKSRVLSTSHTTQCSMRLGLPPKLSRPCTFTSLNPKTSLPQLDFSGVRGTRSSTSTGASWMGAATSGPPSSGSLVSTVKPALVSCDGPRVAHAQLTWPEVSFTRKPLWCCAMLHFNVKPFWVASPQHSPTPQVDGGTGAICTKDFACIEPRVAAKHASFSDSFYNVPPWNADLSMFNLTFNPKGNNKWPCQTQHTRLQHTTNMNSNSTTLIHNRWLHQSHTNRRSIAMQGFTIADVKIWRPIHNS